MRDVLSAVTFVTVALGIVVFLNAWKPDALSAVTALSKPAHCKTTASRAPACRSEPERLER
jgi:hypothetical protein